MRIWLSAVAAAAALSFVLGCSGSGETGGPATGRTEADGARTETAAKPKEPQQQTEPAPPPGQGTAETDRPKNNISVASPQTETIDPETPDDWSSSEGDPSLPPEEQHLYDWDSYSVTSEFDAANPTLMGFALGASAGSVALRFGDPLATFALPDDEAEAAVHSYPGFAIGFRNDKILFIEVSSPSVNPGLNGVRLGDSRETAIGRLGEPTSGSDFVLNYAQDGAVLKIDIDPELGTIQSFKLFPDE